MTMSRVQMRALITRYSRRMSCAVARTWPSGGLRTTHCPGAPDAAVSRTT